MAARKFSTSDKIATAIATIVGGIIMTLLRVWTTSDGWGEAIGLGLGTSIMLFAGILFGAKVLGRDASKTSDDAGPKK